MSGSATFESCLSDGIKLAGKDCPLRHVDRIRDRCRVAEPSACSGSLCRSSTHDVQFAASIAEIAWASGRPIGFEAVPAEPGQPAPSVTTLNVMGKTVEEMLDALVARDVRYSWSEENAVLHLRPRASRRDSNSPLNRKIDAFAVRDVTLADASHEIHFLLQPELRGLVIVGSGIAAHQLGLRRFDVNIANTTVLGVLDAIVMAHGASSWHVTYSQTGDWLHIGFDTFDGWGTTW
jgi:hypothetical protein